MIQNTECTFTDAYKAHKLLTARLPKEIYEHKDLLVKPVPISGDVWQSNHTPWESLIIDCAREMKETDAKTHWHKMRDLDARAIELLATM